MQCTLRWHLPKYVWYIDVSKKAYNFLVTYFEFSFGIYICKENCKPNLSPVDRCLDLNRTARVFIYLLFFNSYVQNKICTTNSNKTLFFGGDTSMVIN